MQGENDSPKLDFFMMFSGEVDGADEREELFAEFTPFGQEFLVGLVMGFDLKDLDEFADADVERCSGLEPTAVDTATFDKGGETAM